MTERPPQSADPAPTIEFVGITKSFSGVRVLDQVTFDVPAGHTIGLVGENGAGKSTLMNVLGGNLRPEAGTMRLEGRAFAPSGPARAARAGIAFIHQELNLFPNLTIAENLHLTRFPRCGRFPWIDRAALHQRTVRQLREVGLDLPPETPVDQLSAGERQMVEIAKALSLDARLLILDEPTTSLSLRESEQLFQVMGRLRARNLAMIYISHHLGEVLRLADDLVVLRDGSVVGRGPRSEFDAARLITLMVGRSLSQLYPERSRVRTTPTHGSRDATAVRTEPLLEVRNLSQPGMVHRVSFTLAPGEVLGISGLMGAGRSELARILFGLDPAASGTIHLQGERLDRASIRRRIRGGLAFLTEDRREEGLCLEASIADNLALVSLPQQARGAVGWLNLEGLRQSISRVREAVRLTPTARDDQPVRTLSGGNQQKVVLAKWLLAQPRVLILDEPTRGIDVGAKFEIYQLIHALADDGAGVLLISSEIEELIGLCDRILVMRRGEVMDELARPEFDRERILRSALEDA